MLMERDLELKMLLEDIKYITPSYSVGTFFKSIYVARRRLRILYKYGMLDRVPSGVNSECLYYIKGRPTPVQVFHSLGVLDFWYRAKQAGGLVHFEAEYSTGNIRPDAYLQYDHGDKVTNYFYEYERTNHPSSFAKKVKEYEAWVKAGGYKEIGKVPKVLVETRYPAKVLEVIKRTKTLDSMRWEVHEKVDYVFVGSDDPVVPVSTNTSWKS